MSMTPQNLTEVIFNPAGRGFHCRYSPSPGSQMGSIVQNGWDQRIDHYTTSIALTLLYYDYVLTFDRERRLVWSQCSFKQWGTVLFFLNRYCGVIGHVPVFILKFAHPGSLLYHICKPLNSYHQTLAVILQTIVGLTFITRTYALYNRSRAVVIGLTSLALSSVAVGSYLLSQGQKLAMNPVLPEGIVGCSEGLSWSESWRLAVAWSTVMIFDLIVVVMTSVRTIKINRRSGKNHTLPRVLMRDGVVYFGVISLATLSNIITFVRGTEVTRGVATTITNVLSTVLVSRLMFNIREQAEHPATAATTAATGSAPMSTTLLHTLTNVDHVDETAIWELEVPNHQGGSFCDMITCEDDEMGRSDIEMVQIVDCSKETAISGHDADE
ncbi:hypothetical protein BJ322DRAFT_635405 [Thelephora terrestris]|uniref:DUF6533 domain-containing protein n=1 Tax=Thelephora terrestris TaxID=56493 RepID=A0A9P6HL84_9AGAM|nr:hypothetical protein BJ322DRAFT_635405 [Thelephora terrestris]